MANAWQQRLMQKLEEEAYNDPEEEIRMELERIRIRAEATAAATKAVWEKNRIENRKSRLKYELKEKKRRAEEQQKRIAQFNKLASLYDNSPFRHEVGEIYFRFQDKKKKQEMLDMEQMKIYETLDKMTGTPTIDVVKLANRGSVDKVKKDPIVKIELERRNTQLDAKVLAKEQEILTKMVDDCVEKTLKRFPIIHEKLSESFGRNSEGLLNTHTSSYSKSTQKKNRTLHFA